jgi:hypothetical protein
MLTFFRYNTIFHIASLLLIFFLIRIPFVTGQMPILLPELEWMLVGEKMQSGAKLYSEIWTNVSPFSAWIYSVINFSFGRTPIAYQVVALLLSALQALYFTYVLNTRQAFLEKNYVPGLVYILLLNISFDCSKLSPALMATTFLLLAFNKLIKQMERREGVSDEVFEVGLYIGIASLFHQPTLIFIVWSIFAMIFFTNANLRQHFLSLLGFTLPLFGTGLYFFFNDSLREFEYNWFDSIFRARLYSLEEFKSMLLVVSIPVAFAVFGFLSLIRSSRFNSYQTRMQQIMLLWAVAGVIGLFLSPNVAPMQFIIFIPCLSFFISGFFIQARGSFFPDLIFILFFFGVLFIQYQGVTPFFGKGYEQLTDLRIKPKAMPVSFNNQKILIIGERIDEYKYTQSATCYLNWDLSKIDLQNPDNYESIINIFDNFRKDPPSIIYDKEKVIPKIFQRVPELAKDYKETKFEGVYERINK